MRPKVGGLKAHASATVLAVLAHRLVPTDIERTLQNCNGDASDSYPFLNGVTVNNGAWAQVTGVVDLTACTMINKLYLFAGAASGNLYIDDVSLTPL